jgi:eukaryotic-like serine/threonine-protein kinase
MTNADPYIGRTLDKRYRVDRLIGRGGMGAVYEAHHIGLDRRVAVKFILGGDADAKARFKREARAASKIDHDHVVHIYDVGVDETGVDFIAMEFVEGTDLMKALETGALEPARQLVAGLGAVHEAGIVHRDIKPANIMLTEHDDANDFVKIMDFGISKAVDRTGTAITLAGRVVGTPGYMAPEQLVGEDADPRSDLYAAALVIYEMLAGTTPIRADNTDQLVDRRLREHPSRLDEVNPTVPVALARVIDRALDRTPAQRYQTADEFLAALDIPIDKGRLDSKTVAVRPAPSELPTAQLTPATAMERPAVHTPVVTAQREATAARPRWPLVLAVLLVFGVPLGVFVAMRGTKKTAPTVAPATPPIAVAPADATLSESAMLLAAARQADRENKHAEALALYRRYLEADPNAPDATHVVERIAALAPPVPTPPVVKPPTKPVVKSVKSCSCVYDELPLCKAKAPQCRCAIGAQSLCASKPTHSHCMEMNNMPVERLAYPCSGWMSPAQIQEMRGTVRCEFCPTGSEPYKGHTGDTCSGFHPTGGASLEGRLAQCR